MSGNYLRAPLFFVTFALARFAAHLFLKASDSRLRPSGVIPPLRFEVAGAAAAGAAGPTFLAAHLALSASESLFRPSAVIPPGRFALTGPAGAGAGAGAAAIGTAAVSKPGPSISRNAAKARSIPIFCCSSFLITSFKLFAIFTPVGP
jgi:hypothetical protein